MDSHIQAWKGATQGYGMVKGPARGHKGGSGDDSLAMRFGDPVIHSFGYAEIVRIDNEAGNGLGFKKRAIGSGDHGMTESARVENYRQSPWYHRQ